MRRLVGLAVAIAAASIVAACGLIDDGPPEGTDVSALHGTYAVQGVVTQDDCGASAFTGTLVLSGKADGTSLIATLTAQGATGTGQRVYNGRMEPDGTFRASGSGSMLLRSGAGSYGGTLLGKASAETITAVESLTLRQEAGCASASHTVVWAVNGRRG
ncbi:MAG: hypothetical protein FJ318_02590 [SAR202 cluster bacterium]|nr:hypothetical protein [SAR202 cluster bacterium]